MPIVTVKNKYQVVIPRQVRVKLGIALGDVLEARAERGKIVYAPKVVVDRHAVKRAQGRRNEFLRALRAVQADAKRKGLDKVTMRDIDAMIAEVRGQRATPPRK